MNNTTEKRKNGIQWTITTMLDDLDFADDIALLSHNHNQMQEKTDIMNTVSKNIGLKINRNKTKVIRILTANNNEISVDGEPLEDVSSFTYLGSTINKEGGVEEDVKKRIQKARHAFVGLDKIWKNKNIMERTKIKIFNSNVKSILLYGSETWRMNKQTSRKIQAFTNRCLRRIVNIYWPNTISNLQLFERTKQTPTEIAIKKRKWRWIGHTLRKPKENITRQGLQWNPQGSRPRGRPRNTWRREVEKEMKETNKSWLQLERLAQDRGNGSPLLMACVPLGTEKAKKKNMEERAKLSAFVLL